MILEYIVNSNNKTINQIISEEFDLSNRLFLKLIKQNKIYLNNKVVDTRNLAKTGDSIKLDLNYDEDNSNIVPTKMNLNILYEDDAFLVLNKPAGIAAHPSILHYENSLSNGVRYYFDKINLKKKIRPINRLDIGTSGIILFAKNEYVQEALIQQMAKGSFKKEYMAVVSGFLDKKTGIIDAPISRKEESIIERCIDSNGQTAKTEYEVIDEFSLDSFKYSVVKCKLHTGRTHQIRVHMAYIGHPLIGDSLYGNITSIPNVKLPVPFENIDTANPLEWQLLCSSKVSFLHPVTKKAINVEI